MPTLVQSLSLNSEFALVTRVLGNDHHLQVVCADARPAPQVLAQAIGLDIPDDGIRFSEIRGHNGIKTLGQLEQRLLRLAPNH